MNKFGYSITIFDENIDDVAIRLGECQGYSEKISTQMLSDAGVDMENGHLNFFQLLKLLKKRKDLIVYFYCVKENDQFHIFSDFFNLDGAFYDAFSFFNDISTVLMMCERKDTSICVSLIKRGKILFTFTVETVNEDHIEHNTWRQDYVKLYGTISGMPSITDIEVALDFILQNSSQSDNQIYKYLEEKALFKDKYIV